MHHRLIDMGFNQKQAVAILYVISVVLGLVAVVLTTSGELRAMFIVAAVIITLIVGGFLVLTTEQHKIDEYEKQYIRDHPEKQTKQEKTPEGTKEETDEEH